MPKVKNESRRTLPEVLELELSDEFGNADVVNLLEEAANLKDVLNKNVSDDDYIPSVHLARRYESIKEELNFIQQSNNLEGLRHNQFVFVSRLQEGRRSVDVRVLVEALLGMGVRADWIEEAMKKAEKQGEAFWVKEVEILK